MRLGERIGRFAAKRSTLLFLTWFFVVSAAMNTGTYIAGGPPFDLTLAIVQWLNVALFLHSLQMAKAIEEMKALNSVRMAEIEALLAVHDRYMQEWQQTARLVPIYQPPPPRNRRFRDPGYEGPKQ